MADFIVCETVAAIVTHIRQLTPNHPANYSGHKPPRPLALCGSAIAWDMKLPLDTATCSMCLRVAKRSRA
jgi:hypothetical protein